MGKECNNFYFRHGELEIVYAAWKIRKELQKERARERARDHECASEKYCKNRGFKFCNLKSNSYNGSK